MYSCSIYAYESASLHDQDKWGGGGGSDAELLTELLHLGFSKESVFFAGIQDYKFDAEKVPRVP